MHDNNEYVQDIIKRLQTIEGQVGGLQSMVEQGKYCVDILTQASAVKASLLKVEEIILENHLRTHVIEHIRCGNEDQAIEELLDVYRLAQRKK